MKPDILAQKLFEIVDCDEVLMIAKKKIGGYVGFEPIDVVKENGMVIILLDPVEMTGDKGGCDECPGGSCKEEGCCH